jgi:hypothetical protein
MKFFPSLEVQLGSNGRIGKFEDERGAKKKRWLYVFRQSFKGCQFFSKFPAIVRRSFFLRF